MLLGRVRLGNACAGRQRPPGRLASRPSWRELSRALRWGLGTDVPHKENSSSRRYLEAKVTEQGFCIMLFRFLLVSVHCSHGGGQTTVWPDCLGRRTEQCRPLLHRLHLLEKAFWVGCGILQQYGVNMSKWESLQMVTGTLVQSIINKWIDFVFIS